MPIVTLDVNGNTKRSAPFANPTASIGLSVANGVSNTALRSDAAQALSQAIAPTWTAAHIFTASNAPITITQGVATSGSPNALVVTGGAHTTLAASTEAIDVNINLARTVQFATGALTTQRAVVFQAPTYGFVGASTLTDAATVAITGAPVKGTNATITNTHGLLIQAGGVSTATNAYGLTVNTSTGATNNYAAAFLGGNVGIGTTSPDGPLSIFPATDTHRILWLDRNASTVNYGDQISFQLRDSVGNKHKYAAIAGNIVDSTDGAEKGNLKFMVANSGDAESNVAMTILNSGNVGIGTTGPGVHGNAGYTTLTVASPGTNRGWIEAGSLTASTADIFGAVSGFNGANARVSEMLFGSDGAVNSGYIAFGTKTAGTLGERVRITKDGNVGIGTTGPGAKLDVAGTILATLTPSAATTGLMFDATGAIRWDFIVGNSTNNYHLTIGAAGQTETLTLNYNGNVGIGTTGPAAQLHTTGTVRFANFGAGTATFDASGNLSSVSDERLKVIRGDYKRGLKEILLLNPILYSHNKKSGLETKHTYAGFGACQVKPHIPEAVGEDLRGYLSFADRPIIAALVNATKELDARLSKLEAVR